MEPTKIIIGIFLSLHKILGEVYYGKEGEVPMDFKLKLKLTRLMNLLDTEMNTIKPTLLELYKKHGEAMEDENGLGYTVKEENKEAFNKEFSELLAVDSNIELQQVKVLDEVDAVEIFKLAANLDRVAISAIDEFLINK